MESVSPQLKKENFIDSEVFRQALTHSRIEAERRGGQYLVDFNTLLYGFQSLKTRVKALDSISTVDRLTLLTSRDGIYTSIREMVEKDSKRIKNGEQVHYLCMAVDLDKFKPINDALGHAGGDFALQKFSDIFRSQLRDTTLMAQIPSGSTSSEDSGTSITGRSGGDEFLAVIPVYMGSVTEEEAEEKINEVKFRIQNRIERALLRMKIKKDKDYFAVIIDDNLADSGKGEYSMGATIIYESCKYENSSSVEAMSKTVEDTLIKADKDINALKVSKKSNR